MAPAVNCDEPPHAGNLFVKYASTDYNSTVDYSCKTCFRMKTSGSGGQGGRKVTRRCDASGKWVGPQPICEGRNNSVRILIKCD